MIRFVLTVMTGILLANAASAQRMPDGEFPPPPPTGLSDEAGILGKNSEGQRRVIQQLQELERESGFQMIVVLKRTLISTSASDMASQLQKAWLPNGGGLVIVFESDTMGMGFGRELNSAEGMENQTGVPAFALVALISDALQAVDTQQTVELYVENLIVRIASGINSYFKQKKAEPNNGRSIRLALVTIGALSFLALCGMGIGWLLGKADRKQYATRVFREVDIPERLGASYGGGVVATAFFGTTQKN